MLEIGDKVRIIGIGRPDAHWANRKKYIGLEGTLTRIIERHPGGMLGAHIDTPKTNAGLMIFIKVKLKKL